MATNAIKRIVLRLDSTGFEKSINKSKRQVKGLSSSFKAAARSAGALFATKQIVSFASEAAKLAGTMDGVQKAFDRFGDVQLFNGLDQAVNGTISKLEIMQQSVKAVNLGVRKKDLATYFEFATRRAAETGEEVSYLVDSIVNGIGRESSRVIDNLGISQERLNAEIEKTGDFQTAVGRIVREELDTMGPRIETTAEKFAQLKASTEDLKVSLGQLVQPIAEETITGLKSYVDLFSVLASGGPLKISDENIEILRQTGVAFDEATIRGRGFTRMQKEAIQNWDGLTMAQREGRSAIEEYDEVLKKGVIDSTNAANKAAEEWEKTLKRLNKEIDRAFIGSADLMEKSLRPQGDLLGGTRINTNVPSPFDGSWGELTGQDELQIDDTVNRDILDQNERQTQELQMQLQRQQQTANNVLMIGNMITTAIQGGGSPGQVVGSILGGLGPLLTAINPVLGAAVSVGGSLITTISGQQLQTVQNRGNYQSGILYG